MARSRPPIGARRTRKIRPATKAQRHEVFGYFMDVIAKTKGHLDEIVEATSHGARQGMGIEGLPVCPAGHLVLCKPVVKTFLKWQFQRYETFCHHCDRRYIIYRWRWLGDKEWTIWRYKAFPPNEIAEATSHGASRDDTFHIAYRPPVEVLNNILFMQELATMG